ncbi:MAG: ribbon-helix-helix protein, CopG family [Solirubrobacteraceae bacterium]
MVNVNFRTTPEQVALMTELANDLGVSRSEMFRQLVDRARAERGLKRVEHRVAESLVAAYGDDVELEVRVSQGGHDGFVVFAVAVFAIRGVEESWLAPDAISTVTEEDESDGTLLVSIGKPGEAGSFYLGRVPLRHNAALRVRVGDLLPGEAV